MHCSRLCTAEHKIEKLEFTCILVESQDDWLALSATWWFPSGYIYIYIWEHLNSRRAVIKSQLQGLWIHGRVIIGYESPSNQIVSACMTQTVYRMERCPASVILDNKVPTKFTLKTSNRGNGGIPAVQAGERKKAMHEKQGNSSCDSRALDTPIFHHWHKMVEMACVEDVGWNSKKSKQP